MSLEIRHVSLADLLSHAVPFQMARYQRHYEWGRKEMDQLLEDLADAFHAHESAPAGDTFHFLGNVILFANSAGNLEVVDGQQRLSSLFLLLSAARDMTDEGPLRTEMEPLLMVRHVAPQPRLKLHRGDDDFLRTHIVPGTTAAALVELGKQGLSGAECLRTNALIAHACLAEMPEHARGPFIRFVLAQGRFVEITVGTEDDAFRIFETVNNRGRPIASEDVLRYALVEYATTDMTKRDELLARWDEMEADLGPRGIRRFISGWRARVAKGARLRQSLHRTVLDSFSAPAEALAFLDRELSGDLSVFKQIDAGNIDLADGPAKKRIDTLLQSFGLLDFDEWTPVVQELIRRGLALPERLIADLARVERLAWFYYLNRDDKGIYQDRRERFSTLMRIVADTGTFEALPPRSLLTVDQCAEMRDIIQGRLDPKWIPLRSLLVRLEMALAGDGSTVVRGDLTIEHVLPLRPKSKAWLSLYDTNLNVVTEHAERIGNLCLVSEAINGQLGNKTYANKRQLMLQHAIPAHSPLAGDIARDATWTREVIARRSKWLLQVFCDTFDVHAGRR